MKLNSLILFFVALSLIVFVQVEVGAKRIDLQKAHKSLRQNEQSKGDVCVYRGSYCETCYECHMRDVYLYCICQDGDGADELTFIDPSTCFGDIENEDGALTCIYHYN